MASSVLEYLIFFGLLFRITAGKLAECGLDHKVLYGIVAVDVGCHEGCAKLEIECPGYKCACFFKKDGRCMLNVKKVIHFRMYGCERVTDSSNRGSRISQLSNVVAPKPKESKEQTRKVNELGPPHGSEKEGVEPPPNVKEEPSIGVEPQTSETGPEKEPEAVTSGVSVEHDSLQKPELDLDEDADHKNKLTSKTKVASLRDTKKAADEETRVLHELFSLEDGFDIHSTLEEDETKDVEIVSQEIAYESFNEDVMVEDLISERRKRLGSRKGSRKRSSVDVKDNALDGAEASEDLKVIT